MNVKWTSFIFPTIKIPRERTQSNIVPSKEHIETTLSIQTLIHDFTPVVLEEDELQCRDNPLKIAFLHFWSIKTPNSA